MKKLLMLSALLISVSALQADIALDVAKTRFNRSNFNFEDFIDALELADKNKDNFTPQEKAELKELQQKTIKMIDKTIGNQQKPVRSKEDIESAMDFHLAEASKADRDGDMDKVKFHLNEHEALRAQLPKMQPLEERDDYDYINQIRNEYKIRQAKKARIDSEEEGFDFADDLGR